MSRRYPPEFHEFMRENAGKYTIDDMAHLVSERFGEDISYSQVKTYLHNHRLRALPRKGRTRPDCRMTTPEQEAFILANYKGVGPKEMQGLVNEKFGTAFTHQQIKSYYSRHHISSGLTGYFEKGRSSYNKGLKQTDFMSPEAIERTKATRFRKGRIPHNGGTPIGEIRWRKETRSRHGYYWIKTAQPNVWQLYHVYLWEQANGPVPDGHMVTYCDGDSRNCCLENLILETKAQHAVKNYTFRHLKAYDKESAEVLNQMADLKMAVTSRKRKRGKQ